MGYPIVHFELPIDDAERATAFYAQALGWKITKWEGPMPYWMISTGSEIDAPLGGGLALRQDSDAAPSITVGVEDMQQAVSRILAAGGTIKMEPTPMPGVGIVAEFVDSEGNTLGLVQES